jgi:hypothetical protein
VLRARDSLVILTHTRTHLRWWISAKVARHDRATNTTLYSPYRRLLPRQSSSRYHQSLFTYIFRLEDEIVYADTSDLFDADVLVVLDHFMDGMDQNLNPPGRGRISMYCSVCVYVALLTIRYARYRHRILARG